MADIKIQTTTRVVPQCYAYTLPQVPDLEGWTKIGFTERDVETRIKEQTHTAGLNYQINWKMKASYLTEPYGIFKDSDFHAYLKKLGVPRQSGNEWFKIDPNVARDHFVEFTQNHGVIEEDAHEVIPYQLREEQKQAVEMAKNYFDSHDQGEFLWNAKPRFGKTLSAYDLCKRLNATKILIVTNRPAIADSWYQDYETFFGPQCGLAFVSNVPGIRDCKYVLDHDSYEQEQRYSKGKKWKGYIKFVSLQDLKGSLYFGGEFDKLSEISADSGVVWDILIIDEAHEGVDTFNTDYAFQRIRRKYTLHLSGTPFKALANEKFSESAIFNWTYADEQQKKREWDTSCELENPYEKLPRLNLFTYQMSEIIRDKLKQGIDIENIGVTEYAFDLNEFFATYPSSGKFIHDHDVDKFLDALTRQDKFPFSTPELRNELKHTLWLLNRVASAKALADKLEQHPVFKDYTIILAAGDGKLDANEENEKALFRVKRAISEAGSQGKTITLSVGQLTTGVTIPEWTAVMMLSNTSSPALYMQAAFRAQNPCLFSDGQETYRKRNAYVFDFDPARTLTIFDQFANDLIPDGSGKKEDFDQRKQNVRELLNFFPVYGEDDDGSMIELDAEKVLTIPRHIHAKEVVERGFMSNFLFANISGIFNAPKEVIDIINNMEVFKKPKKMLT
ncbi:MAG: DEAD/DEAH box helicase family protein [Eubacteriales bacterium]|nr:DEAD/DEAH box helicase family protein [Eubacteriales bacterium]